MNETVSPIPKGFHTVTPHLVTKGAREAVKFYQEAFGADLLFINHTGDDGPVTNAQIAIGDSILMLNDEFPDWGVLGPQDGARPPVTIHLYVEDVDRAFQRAVAAGATVEMPVADQFWGDRYGIVVDPFGHRWSIATRKENLSPEETAERAKHAFGSCGDSPERGADGGC